MVPMSTSKCFGNISNRNLRARNSSKGLPGWMLVGQGDVAERDRSLVSRITRPANRSLVSQKISIHIIRHLLPKTRLSFPLVVHQQMLPRRQHLSAELPKGQSHFLNSRQVAVQLRMGVGPNQRDG